MKNLKKMKHKKTDSELKADESRKITRKQAIKKAGYAAFSAATMMLLINDPVKAQGDAHKDTYNSPDHGEKFEGFEDW